eukprot:scaffold22575_cov141-Cylindrotheca_fusiformis.AAC.23
MKRLFIGIAATFVMSTYMNIRLLSTLRIFEYGEKLGDSVMESFKVLPANRLVHVTRFGLGHRLIRATSAYHLAKSLDVTRMKHQWGSCSKDTNWRGKDGRDEFSIFPYLFGDDLWVVPTGSFPKREGKRIIVRNDVYGYIPGQTYKSFSLPIRKDAYSTDDGPFMMKMSSDAEFYEKLVDGYMFKDEVGSFLERHRFGEHHVIGIHLRLGNGEKTHFEWSGRGVEDESEFLSNFLNLMQSFLQEAGAQNRLVNRKILFFLATDTSHLVPEFQKRTREFGVQTVVLDQIRVKENEGVTFKALAGKEQDCLEGWQAMFSDMLLLSHSDTLIAARHSSFTQSLPLARLFDTHRKQKDKLFCEVASNANSMTCLEDMKTWLFRDDESKMFKVSSANDTTPFGQVVHRLLISLPELEPPTEFEEAVRFLKSPRLGKQEEILMYTYGRKGFNPKYRNEKDQLLYFNLTR